jgi:hypothetical protein
MYHDSISSVELEKDSTYLELSIRESRAQLFSFGPSNCHIPGWQYKFAHILALIPMIELTLHHIHLGVIVFTHLDIERIHIVLPFYMTAAANHDVLVILFFFII